MNGKQGVLNIVMVVVCAFGGLTGCGYHLPGRGANFEGFGGGIEESLNRRPAAELPVRIGLMRLQGAGYRIDGGRSYGRGQFTPVLARDLEIEGHLAAMRKMPHVVSVSPVNRLLLPREMNSEKDVRLAGARMHADVMLVYTLDTVFVKTDAFKPLSVATLGLSPTEQARIYTTASAIIIDTRSGYIYATAEVAEKDEKLTSAWTSRDDIERSRLKIEQAALDKLMGRLPVAWSKALGVADVEERGG